MQCKKYLKVLPISEDMEGEYAHFMAEDELKRQQEEIINARKDEYD